MDSPLPTVSLVKSRGHGNNSGKRPGGFSALTDADFDVSFSSPGPSFDPSVDADSKMSSLVSFINREMTSLGLKCLKLEEGASSNHDVTKLSLASACVEALQRIRMSSKRHEDIQMAFNSLSADNNMLNSQIKKLKNQIDSSEREIAKLKETERQKKKDSTATAQKLNSEKQNNKKNQALVQQKVTQLEHSLKRKEKENQVLKDKMDTFLGSKGKVSVLGSSQRLNSASNLNVNGVQPATIEILNDRKPKRAKWMVTPKCSCDESEKQDFMKAVINNMEQKQQILVCENSDLRNFINKINDQLTSSNISTTGSLESLADASKNCAANSNPICEMPTEVVQETLYNEISTKIQTLAKHRVELKRSSVDGSVSSVNENQPHFRESLLTDDEDSSNE